MNISEVKYRIIIIIKDVNYIAKVLGIKCYSTLKIISI